MIAGDILHNITHRHHSVQKDGIGRFTVCGWRFTPFYKLLFQPDLDGASWWLVPTRDERWQNMMEATTAQQAMTILRSLE